MLQQAIDDVVRRIEIAAAASGRQPSAITLIAVSKQHAAATIRAAYAAGLRHFGENRSDELEQKCATLADLNEIQWHFIGQLQSRQSAAVAANANYFHAVDRLKIAQRLATQTTAPLPVFIEVNISGEGSKAGYAADRWETDGQQYERLRQAAATVAALPRIEVRGLMTMAPWQAPERQIRAVFCRTRQLRERLQADLPQLDLDALSMGMTDDFEIAVEEGATHIRVGRALFGERR